MMAQLRYSGVLETVRIRKEGFPVRLPFQVFIDRYFHWVVPSRTDSSSCTVVQTVHCTKHVIIDMGNIFVEGCVCVCV